MKTKNALQDDKNKNVTHITINKKSIKNMYRISQLFYRMFSENRIMLFNSDTFGSNSVHLIVNSLPFNYEKVTNDNISSVIVRHISSNNYRYVDEFPQYLELCNFVSSYGAYLAIKHGIDKYDYEKFSIVLKEILDLIESVMQKYLLSYNDLMFEDMIDKVYLSVVSNKEKGIELYGVFRETMERVGADGMYALEFSMLETDKDIVTAIPGYSFYCNGIAQTYIKNLHDMSLSVERPLVFVINGNFEHAQSLATVMKYSLDTNIPIVIIAQSFSYIVEEMLKINHEKNQTQVFPIQFPHIGSDYIEIMEDIAAITEGRMLSLDTGWDGTLDLNFAGKADKVEVIRNYCVIYPTLDNTAKAVVRADALRKRLQNITSNDKEEILRLKERIAKLINKVVVVSIGGHHRYNREYRRDLFKRLIAKAQDIMRSGCLPPMYIVISTIIHQLEQLKNQYMYKDELKSDVINIVIQIFSKIINYNENRCEYQKATMRWNKKTNWSLKEKDVSTIESYNGLYKALRFGLENGLLWLSVSQFVRYEEEKW